MSKYVAAVRETHCRNFGGLNCRLHVVNRFFERKNAILTDLRGGWCSVGQRDLATSQKLASKILEISQNGQYLSTEAEKHV